MDELELLKNENVELQLRIQELLEIKYLFYDDFEYNL